MKLPLWVSRSVDADLNVGGDVVVLVGFVPVFAAILIDPTWLLPSILVALCWFGLVFFRWYQTTRETMRPVDKARDAWASKHQSADYQSLPDGEPR